MTNVRCPDKRSSVIAGQADRFSGWQSGNRGSGENRDRRRPESTPPRTRTRDRIDSVLMMVGSMDGKGESRQFFRLEEFA